MIIISSSHSPLCDWCNAGHTDEIYRTVLGCTETMETLDAAFCEEALAIMQRNIRFGRVSELFVWSAGRYFIYDMLVSEYDW